MIIEKQIVKIKYALANFPHLPIENEQLHILYKGSCQQR